MEFILHSKDDLPAAAQFVLQNSKHKHIALNGVMGAGKTTLIKALCAALGADQHEVSSPTFSIVNEYLSSTGESIYHFDFYRLDEPEEALDIGLEEYLDYPGYVFMEWAENISRYLPNDIQQLTIEVVNHERRLKLT
jgi:tRNA threonylcarbamoyladenosine biosynthesis protein TsaE